MKIIAAFLICAFVIDADTFKSLEGKLIGGFADESGNKKYVVSIRYNDGHYCTGCLISKRHVLTAAQCLKEFLIHRIVPDFKNYSVVVGSPKMLNGSKKYIAEVQAAALYNPLKKNSIYDIGLIKLREIVTQSNNVGWIEMASKPPYISSIAEVTIWSRCYSQDPSSDLEYILSTFNVGLEENSLCDRAALTPILCAFSINKNETISPGNVGAPLVQNNEVIGILSIAQITNEDPTIYTAVNRQWEVIRYMMQDRDIKIRSKLPRKRAVDYSLDIAISKKKQNQQKSD